MQIKTTLRYPLTLVRVAINKKSTNNKRWRRCGEREHSCIVCKNVSWRSHYGRQYGGSLGKLGVKLLYDLAIPFLGIYPEETKIETYVPHSLFIAALFIIAKTWKQPRCPLTDEGIKKLWYIYTMEYYSPINRNTSEWVLMMWMNLEPIIQSEVSQREKDKYCILTLIYRI